MATTDLEAAEQAIKRHRLRTNDEVPMRLWVNLGAELYSQSLTFRDTDDVTRMGDWTTAASIFELYCSGHIDDVPPIRRSSFVWVALLHGCAALIGIVPYLLHAVWQYVRLTCHAFIVYLYSVRSFLRRRAAGLRENLGSESIKRWAVVWEVRTNKRG